MANAKTAALSFRIKPGLKEALRAVAEQEYRNSGDYPFDIRKFLVWTVSAELQRELRDLYDKATAAERESKLLLEQAKTRVEYLIEAAVQP